MLGTPNICKPDRQDIYGSHPHACNCDSRLLSMAADLAQLRILVAHTFSSFGRSSPGRVHDSLPRPKEFHKIADNLLTWTIDLFSGKE